MVLSFVQTNGKIDNARSRSRAHRITQSRTAQQIEQIPLFMTKPPEKIDENSSPALQALAQFMIDESSPLGLFRCVFSCFEWGTSFLFGVLRCLTAI